MDAGPDPLQSMTSDATKPICKMTCGGILDVPAGVQRTSFVSDPWFDLSIRVSLAFMRSSSNRPTDFYAPSAFTKGRQHTL